MPRATAAAPIAAGATALGGAVAPQLATADGAARVVDRDALLRTLFPAGILPRQDVIEAVNDWLSEAERLAHTR